MNARSLIGMVAGLVLVDATVQAQGVLSYYSQFPPTGSTRLNWVTTLELPGFESSLGTLTQVKLMYSAVVSQSMFAENMGAKRARFAFCSLAAVDVSKPGGADLFDRGPIKLHRAGILGAFDGTLDFAGASGTTFTQVVTANDWLTDQNLSGYIDVGLIDFIAVAREESRLCAGAGVLNRRSTSAVVSLGVEYTYTPIPEPALGAALLGLAALGLAVFRVRPDRRSGHRQR